MSKNIAYSGLLLALNIVLLILSFVIPTNTLFFMGLASLPISIVIIEQEIKNGIIFYIASIILSFLFMPDKLNWLFYTFTFGLYGIIKYFIERDRKLIIEYILKLGIFNIIMGIGYFFVKELIYVPINIITILASQLIFIVYDYAYGRFVDYYYNEIRKRIRFIQK
jgi:hypothetical protein